VGFLAIARQQQKRSRQSFLAGIKKLIDQILFGADVLRGHVNLFVPLVPLTVRLTVSKSSCPVLLPPEREGEKPE
jgi:hypothetical protein